MSVAIVSLSLMKKTRQPLPDGLAEMPPGPELAAVLATIDPRRLGGLDCVEVMRAQLRQVSHEQARLMAAMVEVGLCGVGPDDALPRMDAPDEFSADEIRGALVWTRAAASNQLSLAWDLIDRLPEVFAALDDGALDVPKTRVLSEWTTGLTDEQAHHICARLLPEAPTLTTGQLAERVKKLAIAIDPAWARRRYEEAVRTRKVVGYRNDDGTANLCGYQLPTERAAAASAHIDALAKRVKQAGDARPLDHIKADLYVGMLDGTYTGWSETDITAHMLTTVDEPGAAHLAAPRHRWPDHPQQGDQNASHPSGEQPTEVAADEPTADDEHITTPPRLHSPDHPPHGDHKTSRTTGAQSSGDHSSPWRRTADGRPEDQITEAHAAARPVSPAVPPARRSGVEIRAELNTLLGIDQHPGEIPGWGFVDAELTRRLVRDQTAAEWRFAITDECGRFLHEGVTRRRPDGYPHRAASPCRGGIVELQIKLPDLWELSARADQFGGWARVIDDLARQADHFAADLTRPQEPDQQDAGRGGRRLGRPLRRRTEIRDRTCVHPRCRAPAHGGDGDHTQDWARGGGTHEGNIGSVCRHDHRLKHEGGWIVRQPLPGHFVWTSRLGRDYHSRPPLIIQPLPDPIPRDPPPPF